MVFGELFLQYLFSFEDQKSLFLSPQEKYINAHPTSKKICGLYQKRCTVRRFGLNDRHAGNYNGPGFFRSNISILFLSIKEPIFSFSTRVISLKYIDFSQSYGIQDIGTKTEKRF